MNAAEVDRMIAASQRSGRWLTADHNRYFDPVVQTAARALADGRLGRLVGMDVFQGAELGDQREQHWSAQLPGGSLHNLASHPLYLARRFAGVLRDLRVVACVADGAALEEVRLVAMGEPALVSITMSTSTRPFTNRLSLYGTEATIEVNLNNMTLIERRPRALPKLVGKVWPNLSEAAQLLRAMASNAVGYASGRQRFYPGIGAHLQTLYERVAAGETPPVSMAEARDVVAWYDEILAQAGVGAASFVKAASA
jgi:predicted dehydrogenase